MINAHFQNTWSLVCCIWHKVDFLQRNRLGTVPWSLVCCIWEEVDLFFAKVLIRIWSLVFGLLRLGKS
jgi:hypothetical protein